VSPIDVTSADEIGQVARAFDQVHAEAVRLAGNEALLRRSFNARVGHTGVPAAYTLKLWSGAIVAAVPAYLVKMQIPVTQPLARGAAVLPLYGGAFLLLAVLLHIPIAGLRRRR